MTGVSLDLPEDLFNWFSKLAKPSAIWRCMLFVTTSSTSGL